MALRPHLAVGLPLSGSKRASTRPLTASVRRLNPFLWSRLAPPAIPPLHGAAISLPDRSEMWTARPGLENFYIHWWLLPARKRATLHLRSPATCVTNRIGIPDCLFPFFGPLGACCDYSSGFRSIFTHPALCTLHLCLTIDLSLIISNIFKSFPLQLSFKMGSSLRMVPWRFNTKLIIRPDSYKNMWQPCDTGVKSAWN